MVTPALIKELREMTGSGMSDCKKALDQTGGDLKKAVEFLREKGLAAAGKKADRITAEGVVAINVASDHSKAAIVEVNCETDFVAINEQFKSYVQDVADQLINTKNAENFLEEPWAKDPSQSVADVLKGKIATIGENLNIRRFERFEKNNDGIISSYVHGGGKIGVLLEIHTDKPDHPFVSEMGYNLCMQIAALIPRYLTTDDVDSQYLEDERRILDAAAKNDPANASKPAQVIEKMVEGRLNKQLKEICLTEQEYVKDTSMTVKAYVESVAKEIGTEIRLARFECYEKGAGIEKKQEDFAEEVAKAMQG
jgi:elongation factor Ts